MTITQLLRAKFRSHIFYQTPSLKGNVSSDIPSELIVKYLPNILSNSLNSAEDSYAFFKQIWDSNLIQLQEQVYALFLNRNNQVIAWRCFHTGDHTKTAFDLKLIIGCATRTMAGRIIIAHNHPLGNLEPSLEDIAITERIYDACNLVDIKLLDHLIITPSGYYSFMDNDVCKIG